MKLFEISNCVRQQQLRQELYTNGVAMDVMTWYDSQYSHTALALVEYQVTNYIALQDCGFMDPFPPSMGCCNIKQIQ
jgi:hypothetical protein